MGGDVRNRIADVFLIVFIFPRDDQVKTGGLVKIEEPERSEETLLKPEYLPKGEAIWIEGLFIDLGNKMSGLKFGGKGFDPSTRKQRRIPVKCSQEELGREQEASHHVKKRLFLWRNPVLLHGVSPRINPRRDRRLRAMQHP